LVSTLITELIGNGKKNKSDNIFSSLKDNMHSEKDFSNINHNNHNTIIIVCDQLINYKYIPEKIKNKMNGYQAFKKIGVEFTNIHNNRPPCSPSRASFTTSQMDTGIGDNIDLAFQYNFIPQLNPNFDTIGKSMKNNHGVTSYHGKTHLDSKLSTGLEFLPLFDTNTRGSMKIYGYDTYNTFGDTYYYSNVGYFTDDITFEMKINNTNAAVDFVDKKGDSFIGTIPFLKSRLHDGKKFHLEFHITNPHDTQHYWQNLSQTPAVPQLQFFTPFIQDQLNEINHGKSNSDKIKNPYNFNDSDKAAYINTPNLRKNYFECSYTDYKNINSLPFPDSYKMIILMILI